MRINNYVSSTGYCSRREADELIKQEKVKINGELAVIGQRVGPDDVVEVSGKRLEMVDKKIYIALNKPKGITSTTEQHIQGNIIDFIGHAERIFPIGRLDKDSEGLILLTNDGAIVNKILAEEYEHEKDYLVTVNKDVTPSFVQTLSQGVKIYNPVKNEYVLTKKCDVLPTGRRTFQITLKQGLNRQIRRMCSRLGFQVVKLKRVRIMNIHLGSLPVGKWRNLTEAELKELVAMIQER